MASPIRAKEKLASICGSGGCCQSRRVCLHDVAPRARQGVHSVALGPTCLRSISERLTVQKEPTHANRENQDAHLICARDESAVSSHAQLPLTEARIPHDSPGPAGGGRVSGRAGDPHEHPRQTENERERRQKVRRELLGCTWGRGRRRAQRCCPARRGTSTAGSRGARVRVVGMGRYDRPEAAVRRA